MRAAIVALLLVPAAASAQASHALGDPAGGARVLCEGDGDTVRLEWRGEGSASERECVAPCLLHVEAGRWHARYEEASLDRDLTVDDALIVLEPHPRNDLELGLGIAFTLAAVAVGAITVGIDEARCFRGEACEGWVPGLLVPAAVVLAVGLIMTFDAGGELVATAITPRR